MRTLTGLLLSTAAGRLLGLLGRFHSDRAGQRAVSRRSFVRNAALGSAGVILAESGLAFYQFFTPRKTGTFGSKINVTASQVPAADAPPLKNPQGKFWLVRNQDGVMALYWKCVHLGCTVPWIQSSQTFTCPCHGSVYDPTGVRIAGPAPRPLDYMAVSVDDAGNVVVDTGDIRERSGYDPKAQAQPYQF